MLGVHGDAVGRGTTLQAGRSRARFPMGSLSFFIDSNSRATRGSLTEMGPGEEGTKCRPVLWLSTLSPYVQIV